MYQPIYRSASSRSAGIFTLPPRAEIRSVLRRQANEGEVGRLIRNPVFFTFAGTAAMLLIAAILLGLRFSQTLQLIFIPYTYDITHGVGATGAKIYSVALATMQLVLITLTTVGTKLEKAIARRIVWGIGIVVVLIFFAIVVLGFLINNFH